MTQTPLILTALTAATLLASCTDKPATTQTSAPKPTCAQLHPYGLPQTTKPLKRNCESGFETFVWAEGKIPLIATEFLTAPLMTGTATPPAEYTADSSLPAEARADPELYTGSGYDRGPLVPYEDLKGSQRALTAAYQTSNLVPENPVLHREAWAALNAAVRDCARREGGATVITGALPGQGRIQDKVNIPAALYKVVITSTGYRAFLMLNTEQLSDRGFGRYEVTLDALAKRGAILAPQWSITPRTRKGTLCGTSFNT